MVYGLALNMFYSIVDSILSLVFGQKYKTFAKKVNRIYVFAVGVVSNAETKDNSRNEIFNRLERIKEKLVALQNQVGSLERQVDEIKEEKAKSKVTHSSPKVSGIPPPPPPPPPMPFTGPAPQMRTKIDNKKILKAVRTHPEELTPLILEPKRSKPSSNDLIDGKKKLRSITSRRSPGGTPMTGWKVEEISSPEDSTTASMMKKALKRKFMIMRPFSPPSPIEGSDGEDFSF